MYIQLIYRHIRRCVRTLGRFGTRHDINASVITVHEYYVDIFILQVSNNTGCNKCSKRNVIKITSNILQKLWLKRNSVYSRCSLIILRLSASTYNGRILCIKYRIYEHHVFAYYVEYGILMRYVSVEYIFETNLKSKPKIYR